LPDEKGEDEMNAEIPQKSSLKQKVAHEFKEMAIVFFYLAFFFCALATYSMVRCPEGSGVWKPRSGA
jgi:hypothetical protein